MLGLANPGNPGCKLAPAGLKEQIVTIGAICVKKVLAVVDTLLLTNTSSACSPTDSDLQTTTQKWYVFSL